MSFPPSAIVSSNASAADQAALTATIAGAWERYLRLDGPGLRSYLADDCIRMSGRWGAGTLQQGADSIATDLGSEAQAYERPTGVMSQEHAISNAELWVDPSGMAATAVYRDTVKSGYRWCETTAGFVLQALTKLSGKWRIAHWTDSFNGGYEPGMDAPGAETFKFDFTYPAADLGRAVDFYTQLIGSPESRTAERAVFLLPRGWRFVLDATRLGGIALLEPGLPNGWATVYVDDVIAERDRLMGQGVSFIAGAETILRDGPDLYAVALDEPDHNPIVITQRSYSTNGPSPSTPLGFTGEDAAIAKAGELARAWVTMDIPAIDAAYGQNGRLLDDTRIKTRGFESGPGVSQSLASIYWPRYDRSAQGLSVDLVAREATSRRFGERTIVSYVQDLAGTGAHPFHETALTSHMLDADGHALVSFTVTSNSIPETRILGPDYIGYPTTSVLTETERFYEDTMGFGVPYVDQAYRGWWSDSGAVYGTFAARPSRDGIPRVNRPSAYNSFWVRSAEDTYSYLRGQGVGFPRIPAIGAHEGISRYPGYDQVVSNDSEGNLVVFTEYTGR